MAHLPNGAVADAGVAALQTARAKCSFDVRALTYVLDQGREMTEMRERIQAKVQEGEVSCGHWCSHASRSS